MVLLTEGPQLLSWSHKWGISKTSCLWVEHGWRKVIYGKDKPAHFWTDCIFYSMLYVQWSLLRILRYWVHSKLHAYGTSLYTNFIYFPEQSAVHVANASFLAAAKVLSVLTREHLQSAGYWLGSAKIVCLPYRLGQVIPADTQPWSLSRKSVWKHAIAVSCS